MAINIPIIDNYRLKSDINQYILIQESNGRETHIAYSSTIEEIVNILIQRKIRGFNSTSIHALLESIKSLSTRLNKALQPLNIRCEVLK